MTCSFRPYEGNEKYIFVSYAHVDGDIVYPIIERLHDAGFRIWFDEGIEWGSEWSESIAEHLSECEVCIAFHSNASAKSMNCRQEVNYALKEMRSILSVYLEDVKLSKGLDMQLSSYQSTFWYQYQDKEQFIDRLIEKTPLLAPCRSENAGEMPESIENVAEEEVKVTEEVKSEATEEQEIEITEKAAEEVVEEPEAESMEESVDESENEPEPEEENDTDVSPVLFQSLREESRKYYDQGKEYENAGDFTIARDWYMKSLEIGEQLLNEVGSDEIRRDLAFVYNGMGNVSQAENRLSEARKWYEKGVAIGEHLSCESGTVEDCRELSVLYHKIGDLCKAELDHFGAKKWYEKGLAIRERIAGETGTMEDRQNLATSYEKLGEIYQARNSLSEAKELYQKSAAIRERVADETWSMDSRRELSSVYVSLATICTLQHEYGEAREWYEKDLKLKEHIFGNKNSAEAREQMGKAYFAIGTIEALSGNTICLKKAEAIFADLAKQYPSQSRYSNYLSAIRNSISKAAPKR
ncbi:MAG: toll/interleukin-1 receptor domain-containing protein [Oscillospiraceae bacterium]|nr:toll/interleukin-1 receptor domain-containing protein [Oscillospiraceae bacterium]